MARLRLLSLAPLLIPGLAAAQVAARLDDATGAYEVTDAASGWRLAGMIGAKPVGVQREKGADRIGAYDEVRFEWDEGGRVRGTIRTYEGRRVAWFGLRYLDARKGRGVVFPRFDAVPKGLSGFSYRDTPFAPGGPGLEENGTPWLRFDAKGRALVLSPASNFTVAKMHGDARTMGVGMNDLLTAVPEGTVQEGLLAFGDGIGRTWDRWGEALRALHDRPRPTNDQGAILRSFGYWTDNGADYYYYDYDPKRGYAGTLLALLDHYRAEGIPVGYLQLDSWWYDKAATGGGPKNPRRPSGPWNERGGSDPYRADKDLFPDGLAAFARRAGVPLVVHGRWIDPKSALHDTYRIAGLAPVDPRYWDDTARYLRDAGVAVYEQDWLSSIVHKSPTLASEVGVAKAFTGGMAAATAREGVDLQYCMALPRLFLQGVEYPNLTTIRTSDDRLTPGKWAHFILTSELAWQIGAYPWTDVFMSGETGNLTLALLSAGPVGTGDALGKESRENIRRAARPDGVLVKADCPLRPCDPVYQDEAAGRRRPFLAETSTGEGDTETRYLFAFSRGGERRLAITGIDVGIKRPSVVFDPLTGRFERGEPGRSLSLDVSGEYAYRVVAPVTRTGVALFGDLGKIVPTGLARIASLKDSSDGLTASVAFAAGEGPVTLTGVAPRSPRLRVEKGTARVTGFDAATGRFTVEVSREGQSAVVTIDGRG